MKTQRRKLVLAKETVVQLEDWALGRLRGGTWATLGQCQSDEFVDNPDVICKTA